MKVTSWQVNGFKSFAPLKDFQTDNPETRLEPSELTVLIGKNNTGKSNLLDSFRVYPEMLRNTNLSSLYRDSVFNQDTSTPISYKTEFTLNAEEHTTLLANLHEDESLSESVKQASLKEGYFNKVRHTFRIKSDSILREELKTNFKGEWILISSIKNQSLNSSKTQGRHLNFQTLPSVNYGKRTVKTKGLGAMFPKSYWSIIAKDTQSWEAIESFREPENDQKPQRSEDLEPDGENLVRVVNTLYTNHRSLFNQFRDRYVSIMEGVTDVSTPYVATNKVSICIHEDEDSYNLEDISAGSKDILTLIVGIVSSQNDTSLLLIEEPELHVHPGAEQEIFELIKDVCRKAGIQVIVSTHSEVFVNQSEASIIARIERNDSTTIRSVSEGGIARELADLGYSKSGLLQSDAVVFVEGRSDKRILIEFCRKLGLHPDEDGIAFVELEGKENLKRDGRSLVKLLYSFDIPYLFVVDSDDLTPEEAVGELLESINRSDNGGWWETSPENFHAWQEYSIESYLLDAKVVARGDGPDLDPGKIKEIISEHGEVDNKAEVLEAIYEEALDIEESEIAYRKDRDGMYIAKRMETKELPSEVREVVKKIGELVGKSIN